jgi:hypothetical protein
VASLVWSVDSAVPGWTIDSGQGTDTIQFTASPQHSDATFSLDVTDNNGCTSHCEIVVSCQVPQAENCTLTQGFYGNAGGKFNGVGTLQLIQNLLSSGDLVVGKLGIRSVTIPFASAQCIIDRLPAGGSPTTLPAGLGDATLSSATCQTTPPLPLKKGKQPQVFDNVFLGQVITLSLNVRLDEGNNLAGREICTTMVTGLAGPGPDGILGTEDDVMLPGPDGVFGTSDDQLIVSIPESVICALVNLGLDVNVGGLLELANRALAGEPTGGASIGDINMAVDAINRGFDGCRFLEECTGGCTTASLSTPKGSQVGFLAKTVGLFGRLLDSSLVNGKTALFLTDVAVNTRHLWL